MDIINKILVGALFVLAALLFVSLVQASGGVSITHLDVSHDMVSYEGFIEIESTGDVTVEYVLIVLVDEKSVLVEPVEWHGYAYRVDHGFKTQVSAWSRTYFHVVETEGNHTIRATVFNGIWPVAVAETTYYVEEDVKECEDCIVEKEDWLGCP